MVDYKEDLLEFTGRSFNEWLEFIDKHPWKGDADTFSMLNVDRKNLNNEKLTGVYGNELMCAYMYTQTITKTRIPRGAAYKLDYFEGVPLKGRFLDHGCGSFNTVLSAISLGFKTHGCDLPTDYFKFMDFRFKKRGIDIKLIPVYETLDYLGDEMFDYIVSHMTLEHVLKPRKVVKYLVSHLNQNGHIYLQPDFTLPGGHHLEYEWEEFGEKSKWDRFLGSLGLMNINREYLFKKQ